MTRAFVLDAIERLIKTFLQTFGATLAGTWAASALSVPDLQHWSSWAKLLGPAIAAGGAAVLSLITSLLSGLKTGTASASMIVAATSVLTATGDHAVPVITSLPAPVVEPVPDAPSVIVADPITPALTEGVTP